MRKNNDYWIQRIREIAYSRNHIWKNRKITIIENHHDKDKIQFHMEGMQHGLFSCKKTISN